MTCKALAGWLGRSRGRKEIDHFCPVWAWPRCVDTELKGVVWNLHATEKYKIKVFDQGRPQELVHPYPSL